jgi:hypothetical protein
LRRLLLGIVATALCSLAGLSAAQAAEISAEVYWERLRQSSALLGRALQQTGAERQPTVDQMTLLWRDVTQVRLPDNSLIDVDVRWLTEPFPVEDEQRLNQLKAQIDALLTYHANQNSSPAQGTAALAALDQILLDERFRYAEATPTPVPLRPTPTPITAFESSGSGVASPLVANLAQIILIGGGVAAVIAVLIYLARALRFQSVASIASAAFDDDPETSLEARERAALSEASTDYRAAIRYLYLASLLLLDERGLIHYDRALTNREHLRQVANQPQLVACLRPVIDIFEQVWYGFMPADQALYEQFRQYVDRLHQLEAHPT